MKTFEEVWHDIRIILENKGQVQVQTLCKKVVNEIVEVSDSRIGVVSQKSQNQKTRFISKDDFAYVWGLLSSTGIYTLDPLTEIIGRRAVTCAILAKLPYVTGKCCKNRVYLTLNSGC